VEKYGRLMTKQTQARVAMMRRLTRHSLIQLITTIMLIRGMVKSLCTDLIALRHFHLHATNLKPWQATCLSRESQA